ncbi:MAG: T9SS type A sorting domain-containing protein [Bacteroidota bacterium]
MCDYKTSSTKLFAGALNVADIPVSVLTISSGTNSGWHLLGNPFTSAIPWYTGWTTSGIGGVANIWNEAGQSYTPINAGGIIPAGNGFMVQVTTASGSLTIPAAQRIHSAQSWYKSSDYPVIKLFAHNLDNPSFQESQVRFNPASTTGFDVEHDGHFLPGYAPLFYSVMTGEKMIVNSLQEVTAETVIPFTFIKNEGTNFTIEATSMETLHPAVTVCLKDIKLGIDYNLSENPVYAFTSTTGDLPARFELHFGSVGINDLPAAQPIIAWYYGGALTVKNVEGLTNIGIFNIRGQQLQNFQLDGSGLQTVQLNLPAGVYFARIVNDGRMKTVKIIVRKI